MRITALAACYNRKNQTVRTVQELLKQANEAEVDLRIVILDDASTDGTGEFLKAIGPNVQVVDGTGGLYWAGGMRKGYDAVVASGSQFDALLVFNDDIELTEKALAATKERYKCSPRDILVGEFTSRQSGSKTYGIWKHTPTLLHPFRSELTQSNEETPGTFNMNFALIPKPVVDQIGFLRQYFVHQGGDFEYGFRARNEGINIRPIGFVGFCERNSFEKTSSDPVLSKYQRFKKLISPKEQPPLQRFRFCQEHGGIFWLAVFLWPYVRIWFPVRIER